MATMAISIDLPPVGEIETSDQFQGSPTDAQMDEEMNARQKFLDIVAPYFASLPNRPLNRLSNVSRVELLGTGEWSRLNHYLVLLTVDFGDPRIQQELLAKLPGGSKLSVVGPFDSLQTWSRS
jgi:hypothetical protein